MQQIKPKAAFMHCFVHALNLSVNDTTKRYTSVKDSLGTCFELIKLIKFSSKRETLLNKIEKEIGSESPSIRTICHTSWTVRAESLATIIANYENIQKLWNETLKCTSDTQMKARIQGVSSQMDTFQFLFNLLHSIKSYYAQYAIPKLRLDYQKPNHCHPAHD